MHSQRHCCICSAKYCKFHLISLLVWLADMTALFLMMCPLSWYQFCVSLTLEGRTVSLVLFLQVLTPLSVLHCLPPAGLVDPVFSDNTFSAAVCHNNSEHRERVACCLCHPCPPLHSTWSSVSGNCCHTSPPPPTPPVDRRSIPSLHCKKRTKKATLIEKRREECAEGDQTDHRVFMIDFHPVLPVLQPSVISLLSLTFTISIQLSSVTLTSDTTAIPPASPPSYRDDLTSYLLSAPLHPPYKTAASHSP